MAMSVYFENDGYRTLIMDNGRFDLASLQSAGFQLGYIDRSDESVMQLVYCYGISANPLDTSLAGIETFPSGYPGRIWWETGGDNYVRPVDGELRPLRNNIWHLAYYNPLTSPRRIIHQENIDCIGKSKDFNLKLGEKRYLRISLSGG